MISIYSCTTITEEPLFLLRPSAETGIEFSNQLTENDSFNIIQYLYFYNGGGVSVGDINKDGLPDIFFTANQLSNRLYLNTGNLKFEDITEKAGVGGTGNWSTGSNMVDINADGWLDIYVCQVGKYKQFSGKNQLFINQKDGSFKEAAAEYGIDQEVFSTQSAFFDYDLDGDLDMYLLNHSVHSSASYQDTSSTRKRAEYAGDKLYRNEGSHFVEVTEEAGIYSGIAGYGLGVGIGDIDQNGCPDIYIGNDFHEDDFVYINNCDGTFSEQSKELLGHSSQFSMGNDLADYNNDGLLDVVTMDMKPADETILKSSAGIDPFDIYQFKRTFGYHHQLPRNMLQLNRGEAFSEIGQLAGVAATDWSWSPLLADFDNDGWKDLHVTNGIVHRPNDLDYLKFIANKEIQANASDLDLVEKMPNGKVSNFIFKNNKDLTFADKTNEWGITRKSISNGAAYADLDNDGDLDLIVNNINEKAFIYENTSQSVEGANYLIVNLQGSKLNPFGIGATVTIYHFDKVQFQSLNPTRGWQSSVDYSLHFGLGEEDSIDYLEVEWADGKKELKESVAANQALVLSYENAQQREFNLKKDSAFKIFQSAKGNRGINFQHQENRFSDLNRERLIPYLLSTQGPKIAVGDVNGDQLDDFYIGGASGQSGALFLQNKDGEFTKNELSSFLPDLEREDTACQFFDADNDGDLDLYVGSGGNEYYRKNELLKDRLFFNDGMGNFTKKEEALPIFYNQTSCVLPADFDQDGDLDLFVGSRSIPVNYGLPPASYLLENDGTGNFKEINAARAPTLQKLGMVTAALWTDYDLDKDLDLMVVGEWMPIKILENRNGSLVLSTIQIDAPNRGWWNKIAAGDFDEDGDEDYIVGNWGLNSNLQVAENEPLSLYIKDFDKNLSKDPVLTYYQQGKEYPIHALDELSGQMVFLKKRYRQYGDFAQHTFRDIFPIKDLKGAMRTQVNNLSSVFLQNNGKKGFTQSPLPLPIQQSLITAILVKDFDEDGHLDALVGGNLHDVQPSIGRLDASYGSFLKGDGKGNFEVIENRKSGLWLKGQVKDIVPIKIAGKAYFLVARNGESVQLFSYN